MGASFAFFVAIPRAFTFLSGFHRDLFDFSPTFWSVLDFYLQVTIGMGLAFELPIFMYLLARLGFVTVQKWSKIRRYAMVVVLIAAAIITPTPDPFNMMIVAIPIYIIFELGIVFARIGDRRHRANPLGDRVGTRLRALRSRTKIVAGRPPNGGRDKCQARSSFSRSPRRNRKPRSEIRSGAFRTDLFGSRPFRIRRSSGDQTVLAEPSE